MILYGLRLLVALLTFAAGTAAAWLFDFKSEPAAVVLDVRKSSPRGCDASRSLSPEESPVIPGGILQWKTIGKDSPAYPHYGKVARVSGKVVVHVEVGENGKVSKAKARGGFGMLPEAAERDALNTRFEPVRVSGQPVRVAGIIMYDFVLD